MSLDLKGITKDKYTINEIASIVGESAHTIRLWENEFDVDVKFNNKKRIYSYDNLQTFKYIKELIKSNNFSSRDIRRMLMKREIESEITAAKIPFTKDMVTSNPNIALIINSFNASITNFKNDIIKKFETSNNELADQVNNLEKKLEYIEDERSRKLDVFIGEWREKNRRRGIFER